MAKQNLEIDKATLDLIEGSSIEQLKELAKAHVLEIAAKNKTIAEQDEVISQMSSELDKKSTEVAIKQPVVKIGKTKFKVNAPIFRIGSEVYKAEELESNEALAKELLSIKGQAILTEIN